MIRPFEISTFCYPNVYSIFSLVYPLLITTPVKYTTACPYCIAKCSLANSLVELFATCFVNYTAENTEVLLKNALMRVISEQNR